MENVHVPVLLDEVIDSLNIETGSIYMDGTLGGGGHTSAILDKGGIVYASDADINAVNLAKQNINSDKLFIKAGNFADVIREYDENYFDGILLDLGFSSNQLEASGRGFSYLQPDERFDLRYDDNVGESVYTKISRTKSDAELGKIIYEYSGETLSMRIARPLFELIKNNKNIVVSQVVEAITSAIPRQFYPKRNAIYSRVWQALRIWTNDEMSSLDKFLQIAPTKLKKSGVLSIITFHSLEDKVVMKQFRTISKPFVLDTFGNTVKNFEVSKSEGKPTAKEIEDNPRSRSARLRVLTKLS
jgi:16S rRNA (cytosine1402-N4)-methyltransferase